MDIEDLRLFVLMRRLGNLTEAARQLHLPKSTASRSIAALEDSAGMALITRSNRGIVMTEAGSLLYDPALKILERYDEASSGLDQLRQSPKGILKVSVPVNPGQFLIAPLIGRFLDRYPQVEINLFLTGDAVEPLANDVDVAIRTGKLRDSSIVARKLGIAHLGLYASPTYLAVKERPTEPEQLEAHELVDIADRGDTWTLSNTSRTVSIPAHCRLLVNDTTVIKTVLIAGFGVGWLPTYMGDTEVRRGVLERILLPWSRGEREVHALFAQHRLSSPKVRAFIDYIAEELVFPG